MSETEGDGAHGLRFQGPHERQRFWQLLLLAGSAWGVTYARSAIGPLQEAMRQSLSLSDNQVAWLQGPAIALPMALGAIPLGSMVDRYPRTRLFLIFTILSLLASVLSSLVSGIPQLFVARFLVGLATVAIIVAAYSMVADLYVPTKRGRATMVVAIGELGGAPAAFALGGTLLTIHGIGPEGWRWSLCWMTVALLPVVLSTFALHEPSRTGLVGKKPRLREIWPALWRHRAVVTPLVIARMVFCVADGGVVVWAAPSLQRRFGLPPDRVGVMIAAALLIGGALGPLLGGQTADLCQRTGGPRRTLVVLSGLALLSVPVATFAILPNATLATIALAVFLTLGYTVGTVSITLATIVIPGELRGLFLAIMIALGALFFIGVAPLVVSSLSVALGGPRMIGIALTLVCAVMSALGAVVFAFGRQYLARHAVSGQGVGQ